VADPGGDRGDRPMHLKWEKLLVLLMFRHGQRTGRRWSTCKAICHCSMRGLHCLHNGFKFENIIIKSQESRVKSHNNITSMLLSSLNLILLCFTFCLFCF